MSVTDDTADTERPPPEATSPPVVIAPDSGVPPQRNSWGDPVLRGIAALRGDVQELTSTCGTLLTLARTQSEHLALMADTLQAHLAESNVGNGLTGLRVLHVEDTRELREVIDRQLEAAGAFVESASSIVEALELTKGLEFDAILLDDRLPDGEGSSLAVQLRQRYPRARIVLTSGYVGASARPGAVDVIRTKPVRFARLKDDLRGTRTSQ